MCWGGGQIVKHCFCESGSRTTSVEAMVLIQVRNDGGLDQEQAVEMERGAETWDMFSRKNRGDRGIDLM